MCIINRGSRTSDKKDGDDVKKFSITVGGVLTFIVSLFLYRDLASFIVDEQLASGSTALGWALAIEIILGAAAGIGVYYSVMKLLITEGIMQKLLGLPVGNNFTPAKPGDTAKVGEPIKQAKTRLPSTTYRTMAVLDHDELAGILSDSDLVSKAGDVVDDVMTPRVVSVSTKDNMLAVYNTMMTTGLARLPVYDEREGKKIFKGWIALADVMKSLR
jgi:CBS domain-containing protein